MRIWESFRQLLQLQPGHQVHQTPPPVQPRVLLIIHDPIMVSENGRKLHQLLNWNNPDNLVSQYIFDVEAASFGYVIYQVVERIVVDAFPI